MTIPYGDGSMKIITTNTDMERVVFQFSDFSLMREVRRNSMPPHNSRRHHITTRRALEEINISVDALVLIGIQPSWLNRDVVISLDDYREASAGLKRLLDTGRSSFKVFG